MDDLTRIKQLANIAEDKTPDNFVTDIESATENNDLYRNVLYTGPHLQLVLMSLNPGEEIGEEVHKTGDQFFRVELGSAEFTLGNDKKTLSDGAAVIVPQGMRHNVRNIGNSDLKLYVMYSPPEHPADTQQQTKPLE